MALQHHTYQRMPMQGAVKRIELLARRGTHRERDAEVVAPLARPHLDRGGVKARVVLQHDRSKGLRELGMRLAHHLDGDRKSTRLNSSHVRISYAVFCLKKKSV